MPSPDISSFHRPRSGAEGATGEGTGGGERLQIWQSFGKIAALLAGILCGFVGACGEAQAIPAFARRYHTGCNLCHQAWPHLNRAGYTFRAMGYRMPDEVGKDKAPQLDRLLDAFAVRGQASFNLSREPTAGVTADVGAVDLQAEAPRRQHVHGGGGAEEEAFTGPSKTRFGFGSPGVELFESVPFADHFSNFFHLALGTAGGVEIEAASLRGVVRSGEGFLQAKAGIMHPLEGFSALDHPIVTSHPLILETPAEGKAFTFFHPSQLGVMVGAGHKDSLASLSLFNGLNQTGLGTLGFLQDNDSMDVELSLVQFIGDTGGAVQAVGYLGTVDKLAVFGNPSAGTFRNNFWRAVLAANYPPTEFLNLVIGGGIGKDDELIFGKRESFKSFGFFAEADLPVSDHVVPILRYDLFDPTDEEKGGRQAITLGCSVPRNFLRLALEYQVQRISGEKDSNIHRAQATLDFAY